MRQNITRDEFSQLPLQKREDLVKLLGVWQHYLNQEETVYQFFTIGTLIFILNSHQESVFNLQSITRFLNTYTVTLPGRSFADKELIKALWTAVVFAYDDIERERIRLEEEKVWSTHG